MCFIQDGLQKELEKRKKLIHSLDCDYLGNIRGGLSLADLKSNLLNLTFKDYQAIGIPAIQDNIKQLFTIFEQIDSYRLNYQVGKVVIGTEDKEVEEIKNVHQLQNIISKALLTLEYYKSIVGSQKDLIKLSTGRIDIHSEEISKALAY